jgi:hypothetical protein
MRWFVIALALVAFVLAGCPEKVSPAKADASACTKIGQSCEYAPGKLGSCVQQDDCATPPCLVCQSQH